jgi:hypothetical protein
MSAVVTNTAFDTRGPQDPNGGASSGYKSPKYVNNATINTYQGGFTNDYGMQGLVLGVDWSNLTSSTTLTITFTTPVSGPVTFNIYDINSGSGGGFSPTFIDKVTITGTNCAGALVYPTVSGCSNSVSGPNSNIITGTLGCTNTTNTITFNAPSVKTITITYASSTPLASGYGNDPDPQYIIVSDITANLTPLVSIGSVGAGITCASPTVTLNGSSSIAGATYSWQGPNSGSPAGTTPTSSSTTVSAAGTYLLIVTDPSSGCNDTASVVVNQTGTPPNLNINPPTTLTCTNTPVTLTATSTTSGVTYAWSGGGTGPTKSVTVTTTYTVTATVTATGCTATANVTVNQNITAPNSSIAPPAALSCAVTTVTLTASSTTSGVTYAWSGGGTGTTKNVTTTGPYTVTVTDPTNGCTSSSTVTVTGSGGQNAGPDQNISCYPINNSATMAATGTGTWAAQTGNPGTATITSSTNPTTTITSFSVAGTYHFIWSNGGCADTAAVIISVRPNAGADQLVSCAILPGGFATMAATGTGTWTAQAGNPGTATITNSTSATTTITTFNVAGTYNFIWTNGGCSDTASVVVTAKPNAGPDHTITCAILPGGSATMAAAGTGSWTAQTGNPGTAIITTPTSPASTITSFSAAGIYHFIWTNGSCTDTATITVTGKPNAGTDQFVSCFPTNNSATMAATGAGSWTTQVGNPGTATITNAASPTTTITSFSTAGTYNFIWTNGSCTDTASVILTAKPNAGADQFVTCATLPGGSATMAAAGTGAWSAQTGNPGTAVITSPNSPTTTITTFSATGLYYFIWTNGGCSDTASVSVTAKPNAGPNQFVSCFPLNSSATMAGTGTGIWTAQVGNPGTATITTPSSASTSITAFSVAGTYNFIFTNGSCSDTASVTLTAQPNAGADQTVSCITLPGGIATMAAAGTGTWTAQAGNPGSATITSPSIANTSITGFTAAGTYSFVWTTGTCTDTANVIVSAKPDAGRDTAICQNASATLNANGAGTWSPLATNPASTIIANTASASTAVSGFSAAGTYAYVWTVNGCTDTATVLVHSLPSLTPSVSNITCLNPTGVIYANASGTGPFTYQWSNTTNADSITTTTTGSLYFVTVTDNNSCTASASDSVSNLTVTIVIADSIQNANCGSSDGKVTLYISPAGNYNYIWSVTGSTDSITALSGGTYYFTVSNAQGCQSTGSALVGTNNGPAAPAVSASGPLTFCQGDSVVLTSSASTGNIWSNAATTRSIIVYTSGSYTVTQTSGGCTSPSSASVLVTMNPTPAAPTISASGLSFCPGDSVVLTSSSPSGNLWSDGETTQTIIVKTTSTYTVTDTQGGCPSQASAPISVAVLPAPQPVISASQLGICADSSVTLDATTASASSYLWSTMATQPAIIITTAGFYQVTVTANGCTGTDTITIYALPSLGALSLPDTSSICSGDAVTLNATAANATSYLWSGLVNRQHKVD